MNLFHKYLGDSYGYKVAIISGIILIFIINPSRDFVCSFISSPEDKSFNESSSGNEEAFAPLSLFVEYKINKSDKKKMLNKIRELDRVRELSTSESGKSAKELSDGIYSFVNIIGISARSYNLKNFLLTTSSATRFPMIDSDFEVHYLNKDKINLIGYTSEEDVAEISYLSGSKQHSIKLSPILTKDFSSLVAIPIDRILKAKDRTIEVSDEESYDVLELEVK